MKSHRAQAQFERAKWKIAYLAPLWALQALLSILIVGIFSWRLAETARRQKEEEEDEEELIITYVWEVANIMMSLAMSICIVVEVTRYIAESLTPWIMLFSNVAKLTYSISILVLDLVVFVQREDTRYSLVSLGIDIVLMITAIAMIIFAIVGYRRFSAYDEYSHPANVKGYGFNDGPSYYSDNSYSSRSGMRMSVDRRISMERGRVRLSSGSSSTTSTSTSTSTSTVTTTSQEQSPRSSSSPSLRQSDPPILTQYSHERDTRFEEYLSLRAKNLPATAAAEQANWESTRTVGAAARARGASTSKSKNLASEHLLLSVPEEEGDGPEITATISTTTAAAAAKRSTDSEGGRADAGNDVSASVPLMSGHENVTRKPVAERYDGP